MEIYYFGIHNKVLSRRQLNGESKLAIIPNILVRIKSKDIYITEINIFNIRNK